MSDTNLDQSRRPTKRTWWAKITRSARLNKSLFFLPVVLLIFFGGAGITVAQISGTSTGVVQETHLAPEGHTVMRVLEPLSEEQILILREGSAPVQGDWVFAGGTQRAINESAVIEVDTFRTLPLSNVSSLFLSVASLLERWTEGNEKMVYIISGLSLFVLGGLVLRLGAGLLLGTSMSLVSWTFIAWAETQGLGPAWLDHLGIICLGVFIVGVGIGSGGSNPLSDSARRLFAGALLASGCVLLTGWSVVSCALIAGLIGFRYPLTAPVGLACIALASGLDFFPL